MKKEYRRPEIVFENFALRANIAGDCMNPTEITGHENELAAETGANTCGVYIIGAGYDANKNYVLYDAQLGVTVLTEANSCHLEPQDDDVYNLCYHVPTARNKIFIS